MRQPPMPVLRKSSGAFDLPSIITGVVVVGILAAGVLAAIFGVIPFAQDRGAKQDLSSIRTAEGVAKAKDNRFMDHQRLLDIGYLQLSSTEKTKVKADAKGTCYVGIAKSGTGTLFYSTDANTDPQVLEADTDTGCLSEEELAELIDDVGGFDTPKGAPANLKLTAVSPLQAKAAWDPVKKASGYKVEYQIGDEPWIVQREEGVATTASISALPEETIRVRIYTLMAGGSVSEPSVAMVRLPDSVLKNPSFEQNVESWKSGNQVSISTTASRTGDKAATLTHNRGSGAATVSQVVTVPADAPVLTLWSTAVPTITGATPTLIETDGTWKKYAADFSASAGKVMTITISGGDYAPTIDDVAFEAPMAPAQPTAVAATSRLGAATATWVAPIFPGGTPITSYTVTAWADGKKHTSVTVTADKRTATLEDVAVGTEYTFTVTATNSVGAGTKSAAYGPVPIGTGAFANPSFEQNVESWKSGNQVSISTTASRTGDKAATLTHNRGSGAATVSQVVTVPADAPVLTLWSTAVPTITGATPTLIETDGTWKKYAADFSASAGKVMTITISGGDYAPTIDDVAFEAPMAPAQPTAVAATSRLGAATATWAAPIFSGGTPITSYTVTAWADGKKHTSVTVTADKRTATLEDVTPGSKYTFTVTPTNTVGAGVQSASYGPVPIESGALANPGFEQDRESWTARNSTSVVTDTFRTGGKSLSLAYNKGSGAASVSQTVTVPADASVLTLWATAAPTITIGATPTLIETDGIWRKYAVDFSAYAGQLVTVSVGSGNATLKIDDVAFESPLVPSQPTAVAATSRLASATVTWAAPIFSGGAPATSYTVAAWADGNKVSSVTVAADKRTATLENFVAGNEYAFTVTAANTVGTGPQSAATAPIPIEAGAIMNPGFEDEKLNWALYIDSRNARLDSTQAHSGSNSIYLTSTYGYGYGSATQTVPVPADATQLTYWSMGTVSVAGGKPVPGEVEGAWTKYTVDMSAFAGQSKAIQFQGPGYIDDIAFEAKG